MSSNIKKTYIAATREQTGFRRFGAERTRSFFKTPWIQFVILGVVFALIQILRILGIMPAKYVNVAISIMIYTIVSSGFCLLLGYAGLASLGSSCFVGIGAYCAFYALQQWHAPYIVALLMALGISFVIGLMIGFVSLRVQGLFLGIITLGLSEVIRNVLINVYSQTITIKSRNMKIFGLQAGTQYMYFVVAVTLVLVLILLYNIMHSPTGRNMLAMKNSTSAAQAFGVSLLKYRVMAFIISCMLASLTGIGYVTAASLSIVPTTAGGDPAMALTLSLNVLAAVIIGGYKSLWGSFAGVFFVFGLQSLFSALFPAVASSIASYTSLIIGVLMIVIVMFYPGGFHQLFYAAKFRIKGWKQKRRIYLYGAE